MEHKCKDEEFDKLVNSGVIIYDKERERYVYKREFLDRNYNKTYEIKVMNYCLYCGEKLWE